MSGKGGIHWKQRLATLVIGVACTGSAFGYFAVSFARADTSGSSNPATGSVISALMGAIGFCPSGGPVPIPCPPEGAARALEATDQLVLKPAVEAAAAFAIFDFMGYVLDRLAYEAAIAISSGASGQQPLIFTDDPEKGWQRAGLDVVGAGLDALNTITQDTIGLKLDICDPNLLAPDFRLSLQLGIKQAYQPTRPKCDFLQVGRNWSSFVGSIGETLDPRTAQTRILQEFAKGLRPGQNELSMAVSISYSTREEYNFNQRLDLLTRFEQDGFKDVTDTITGQVKTPAGLLREEFYAANVGKDEKKQQRVADLIANNPEFWWGFLGHAFSVFSNTLASETIKKVYEGYFSPSAPNADPFNATAIAPGGRTQAAERFAGLIVAQPTSVSNYNALGEFVTCPTGGVAVRNINNCVMDQGFFQAVSRGATGSPLTVADAIEAGLIDDSWPLIPPTDEAKNQDPFCYSFGFCYGNLVKLRAARVLPVGWEMAAKLNTDATPATLAQVIDGFDDCESGGKWCHLVDPNWVLTYPQTQCKAFVNGEILATRNSSARAGSCADAPSCVAEDGDGNCVGGYGYCVREKNTWDFQGESCPAQFASCLAFTDTQSGTSKGFLVNSVDFDGCNADNAGCRWYRTNKYPDDKGTADPADDGYSFLPTGESYATAAEDADPLARLDRAYFNRQAKQCQAQDAGCSELLRADGLSLNLLRNGSFEDGTGTPDGWDNVPAGNYRTSGDAFAGNDSLALAGTSPAARPSEIAQDGVSLSKDSFYTVSVFAKGGAARVDVVLRDAVTGSNLAVPSVRGGGAGACAVAPAGNAATLTLTGPADFVRGTCTFTVTADALARVAVTGSGSAVVDAVQLERGELATEFHDGYAPGNVAAFVANLKVPPSYLGCRGLATDPKECDAYAPVCAASDVGCELYDPLDGDPSVPAVASDLDRCPNECVGYAAFKQEATRYEAALYDPARTSFIPETARSCEAGHVGCDAFTNLDTVAAGGEGVEHYSHLRACATPAQADALSSNATYFTWTASQGEGFQLRTWQLLKSDRSAAPCTRTSMPSENEIRCADPSPMPADDACNDHADTLTDLDCGEFYDSLGVIHYRRFSQVAFVDAQCHPYRKTDGAADIATADPNDCVSGGRLLPSGECRYFGLPGESASCPASAAGCRAYTGGAGNNLATVFDQTFEEGPSSLSAFAAVGSLSPALAISADAVSAGGHSLRASDADQGEGIATVSGAQSPLKGKIVSGKTFFVEFFARGSGDVAVSLLTAGGTSLPATPVVVDLAAGWQPFTVGPIDASAVGGFDDAAMLRILATGADTEFYVDNLRLKMVEDTVALVKGSWSTPSTCDLAPNGAAAPQYYLGCEAYKDREGAEHDFYRFGRLCSEKVVGCQAFFDTRASASPYAQTFNARCTINPAATSVTPCLVAGRAACQVSPGKDFCLFSQPGTVPSSAANVVLGPEARVVGNDVPVYLVDDGSAQCSGGSVGCTEMGLPKFSQDKSQVSSFASSYLIDDPDDYAKVLCGAENLFCQEFKSTKDGNFYFKDPIDQTCEYKAEVEIDGQKFKGWFRAGKKEPCAWTDRNANGAFDLGADDAIVRGGEEFLLPNNGDDAYDAWYGSCGTQHDLCTEFRDPTDTQGGHVPQGTSYHFKNDDRIGKRQASSEACDGRVSQKQGCALFFNASQTAVKYSSAATYAASNHADQLFGESQFSKVDPVNCDTGNGAGGRIDPPGPAPEVNLCANRCRYAVGSERLTVGNASRDNAAGREYFGSCLVDDDCPSLTATDDRTYEGECVTLAASQGALWAKNDTNVILQVQPDRQCAEWLACSSSQVSWDSSAARWRNVCDQMSLCTAYDASADESSCASFDDSDPIQLKVGTYQSRDVTWAGKEYSGYSIPNLMPVDLYDQVNIRPDRWCKDGDDVIGLGSDEDSDNPRALNPVAGSHGFGLRCLSESDCSEGDCTDADPEMRLAYVAGTCDETAVGFGGSCVVGFCRQTGSACSSSAECEGGPGDTCAFGFCQAISSAGCTSRADQNHDGIDDACAGASGTPFCDVLSGHCVSMLEDELDSSSYVSCISTCSGAGQECVHPQRVRTGTCLNDQCVTTIGGEPLNAPEDASALACRGYPEPDSPFQTDIAEFAPQLPSSNAFNMPRPESSAVGFKSVNTCTPVYRDGKWRASEDCLCSYDKLTYGEGVHTAYYQQGVNTTQFKPKKVCVGGTQPGRVCTLSQECGEGGSCDCRNSNCTETTGEVPEKICSSGSRNGQPCLEDANCGTGSQCIDVRRQESVFGYQGYCLEKDSTIQLHGSAAIEKRPCLSWYPVEQLAGSTDLFAKFSTAGFAEDAFYCAETDIYYNLHTSKAEGPGSIACAEETEFGDSDANLDASNSCLKSVYCPTGFFAVLAPTGSSEADGSGDIDVGYAYCDETYDDCPYFCVPKDAQGSSCDAPPARWHGRITGDGRGSSINSILEEREPAAWENSHILEIDFEAYLVTRTKFKEFVDNATYAGCVANGYTREQLRDEQLRQGDWIDDGISEKYMSVVFPGITGAWDFYRTLFIAADPYIGCKTVAQVSQSSLPTNPPNNRNMNFAWSDRVWTAKDLDYLVKPFDNGVVEYDENAIQPDAETEILPFGQSIDPSEYISDAEGNPHPQAVAQCITKKTTNAQYFGPGGASIPTWSIRVLPWNETECPDNTSMPSGVDGGEESRAFNHSAYAGRGTMYHPTQGPGVPFDCTSDSAGNVGDADKCNAQISCSGGRCANGPKEGDSCSTSSECRVLSCVSSSDAYFEDSDLAPGSDYVCVTPIERFSNGDGIMESVTRLQQFFAKHLGLFSWTPDSDPSDSAYAGPTTTLPSGVQWDVTVSGDRGVSAPERPSPPVVMSIGDCTGNQCKEGDEDSFSINGQPGGTIRGAERKHVTASFFTYADKDQLPLRNIVVDWGDSHEFSGSDGWPTDRQSGSRTNDNFYKNHRGLQSNGQPYCSNESQNRGLSDDSCDTSYVSFTHEYVCSLSFHEKLRTEGRLCDFEGGKLLNAPCTGGNAPISDPDRYCVFQPRVHVKDNWGWCTGECTGGTEDPGDGCYGNQECDTDFPKNGSENNDPWVYYDGFVIVEP